MMIDLVYFFSTAEKWKRFFFIKINPYACLDQYSSFIGGECVRIDIVTVVFKRKTDHIRPKRSEK